MSVIFLGHLMSKGARIDPKKFEAVKNWVIPSLVEEVRSFVGLISYYCHFDKIFFCYSLD